MDTVVASIGRFAPFLLEGVTGSGKTEVYLAAIADVIARGRQVLVLVPEIALTPQTTRRFRERLGFDVAVLHSGLSERERAKTWLSAARGEARVILGTRSAIFVPLAVARTDHRRRGARRFLQAAGRISAITRVILPWFARSRSDVPLLLGTATPSLESLANAEASRYRRLRLPQRAGVARPPSLQVMDLRRKRLEQGLAVSTLQAMRDHLARGEQVLVFRNRRGYAPVLFCHGCGWTAQCTRCDRPLTFIVERRDCAATIARRRLRFRWPVPNARAWRWRRKGRVPNASRKSFASDFRRFRSCASTAIPRVVVLAATKSSSNSMSRVRVSWSERRCWPRATTCLA